MYMDQIFKALADKSRRQLLDALRHKDGQSLTELETHLTMSRFGVMKHIKLLEEAGLVLRKKEGRFTWHYLNVAPFQEITDRWVAAFLQPQARALTEFKSKLERENIMGKPDFMMQTFIRCTQDALWDALTKDDQMAAYHSMCNEVHGDITKGEAMDFIRPDGSRMLRMAATEIDPKSRIAMTFEPNFGGTDVTTSNMVYLIEAQGETCKLTIEHYDVPAGQEAVAEGWARIASSLKSWLETGVGIKAAA